MEAKAKNGLKISYGYEHRGDICERCGYKLEIKQVEIECNSFGKIEKRLVDRPVCPECGGMTGQLISRETSISPPSPPKCFKCIWRFFKDCLFYFLLSKYHVKRIVLSELSRDKFIKPKYRTGEPSPLSIKSCLWELIKLSIYKRFK